MDKKHNKHIFQKIKKRTLVSGVKRAVSLVLCFALVLTAMPIIEIKDDGGIVVKFGLIDATEKVANAASSEYSPTLRGSAASVTLTSYNDILAYAQGGTWTVGGTSYSGYDPGDTVTLDLSDAQTIDSSFLGIGTSSNPFSGTLIIAGGANGIGGDSAFLTYKASLFNYISESTTILDDSNNPCYIKLTSGSSSLPLFADHVIGDGNSSTKAEWKFYISGSNVTSGGIIGTIGTSDSSKAACVSATVKDGTSGCTVSSSENAGVICRTLEVNSSLDLTIEAGTSSETTPTLKQTSISTTAANSHAGGLIGEMKTGSALTLKSNLSFASARTISAKGGVAYAGGLVGKCCGTVDLKETNEDPNTGETTITYYPYTDIYTSVINGSTTGGAGGAFGYYEATGEAAFDLENEYKITAVKLGGKKLRWFYR